MRPESTLTADHQQDHRPDGRYIRCITMLLAAPADHLQRGVQGVGPWSNLSQYLTFCG